MKISHVIKGVLSALLDKKKDLTISFVDKNETSIVEQKSGIRNDIPKIIWLYWHSNNIPLMVNICIAQLGCVCKDYEIKLIKGDEIYDYILVPKIQKTLPIANLSDYYRLALLQKYGGVWLDASVLLCENFAWLNEKLRCDHDAFLLYSDECTTDTNNPVPETWFIMAAPNSDFISDWLNEFEQCITSDNPTIFYEELISKKDIVQNITKPSYLICYLSAAKVLSEKKYSLLMAGSQSLGHYYNYKYNWNGYAVAISLLFKNKANITQQKLIKFNSATRNCLSFFIKRRLYLKSSLIGTVVAQLDTKC